MKQYRYIGIHLDLTSSRITTSNATLSNLPNIPLTALKKERSAYSSQHLKDWDLKRYTPKHLISVTHDNEWPPWECRLAQVTLKQTFFLVHFRVDIPEPGEYEVVDEAAFFLRLFHLRAALRLFLLLAVQQTQQFTPNKLLIGNYYWRIKLIISGIT